MYTVEEVINKVYSHLLEQSSNWEDTDTVCAYRAIRHDGKFYMCAIGCLIPEEIFEKDYNTQLCIEVLLKLDEKVSSLFYSSDDSKQTKDNWISLLGQLQTMHDAMPPNQWPKVLKTIANKHNFKLKENN